MQARDRLSSEEATGVVGSETSVAAAEGTTTRLVA
jgi:hypothetical protein